MDDYTINIRYQIINIHDHFSFEDYKRIKWSIY